MVALKNEVNETCNFKSFSDEHDEFQVYHQCDLSIIACSRIESMTQNSCYVSYKPVERDGSCFNSRKISVLPLLLDFWKPLKFQLTENEASFVACRNSFKTCACRMEF